MLKCAWVTLSMHTSQFKETVRFHDNSFSAFTIIFIHILQSSSDESGSDIEIVGYIKGSSDYSSNKGKALQKRKANRQTLLNDSGKTLLFFFYLSPISATTSKCSTAVYRSINTVHKVHNANHTQKG